MQDNDSSLILKRITTIRWSCRAGATRAFKNDYEQIKDALKQIADDTEEKSCVLAETEGLLINQLETGIYTTFWNDILQNTHATNKNVQHAKLDLNSGLVLLSSLRDYVASHRDSFNIYERQGSLVQQTICR